MDSARAPLEQVLVEVFREQRSRLWGFFSKGSGPGSNVEDLVQETFLRAWDHRTSIGPGAGPEGRETARRYLWRIARNLMIDEVRRRIRRGDAPRIPAGPDLDPGPEERADHDERLRVLRETLEHLPGTKARRCLELWLNEMDLPGIAREMRLGVNQVRGLLQRARADLIERAAGRLHPAPPQKRGPRGGSP